MEKCVFCHVRDNPHEGVVAESRHALAFMDKHPVVDGHCLVVTRKHHDSLMDASDEELVDLFKLAVKVERALLASGLAEGVDLRQHYRPYLPEGKYVKRHVHIHLVPRKNGDDLYNKVGVHEMKLRREPEEKTLFDTAKAIRKAIK